MLEYVIRRLMEGLNESEKALRGSPILVVGLAYKKNVDDARESPSFILMDRIAKQGGEFEHDDPYIPKIPVTREHKQWTGKASIRWDASSLAGIDAAIIAIDHDSVAHQDLRAHVPLVIDTRNALAGVTQAKENQVWRA